MFFKKARKSQSSSLRSSSRNQGALYINASEFINHIDKNQISGPVSARPMGVMDITACDVICHGVPTQDELKLLRRRVRETASHMGVRASKSIEQSIAV